MLNVEAAFLIQRDREREIDEAVRVRSLLEGRQPETAPHRVTLQSLLVADIRTPRVALRTR
jgi:hypothetical protein